MRSPKILYLDIETRPLLCYTWGIHDQNIGKNQIYKDWAVLSWATKWEGSPKLKYEDISSSDGWGSEKALLQAIWKLLDEADVVIGHNSKRFDIKKLNGKFEQYKLGVPSYYQQIDTLTLAKKYFNLTSNSLEYIAELLGVKYKKLKHKNFPGMELWTECLNGNKEAWASMEAYNKRDVVVLEEVYKRLRTWGTGVNFSVYNEGLENVCACGSTEFVDNGHAYKSSGKFKRYRCKKCKAPRESKVNLLSKEKRKSMRE